MVALPALLLVSVILSVPKCPCRLKLGGLVRLSKLRITRLPSDVKRAIFLSAEGHVTVASMIDTLCKLSSVRDRENVKNSQEADLSSHGFGYTLRGSV